MMRKLNMIVTLVAAIIVLVITKNNQNVETEILVIGKKGKKYNDLHHYHQ